MGANFLEEFAKSDGYFEMKKYAGGFTLDVIATTQFGLDLNAHGSENNLFTHHVNELTNFRISNIVNIMHMFVPWLCKVVEKIVGNRIAQHPRKTEIFFETTAKKIMYMDNGSDKSKPNLLKILKNSQREERLLNKDNLTNYELSDDEIVANAAFFIAAGNDTTANTLSFLFYHLALHPEVQERVLQEIESVFGNETTVTSEKLMELKYLEMCIDETLRIYPPALFTSRQAKYDTMYKDVKILKNWTVLIPIRAIHMDAEKWPEPDKFDPDRFLPEVKAGRDPTYFMPFGAGPRECIGKRLAYLEMKILVVTALRKVRLMECDKTEKPLSLDPDTALIKPIHGIWLKAELR